jgi:meiosis induction protein kinase IME2/SME1
MSAPQDVGFRASLGAQGGNQYALEDRFEVIKEIGDGSFGSVVLARVRTAGAHVARRGTVVSLLLNPSFFFGCIRLVY